MSLLIMASVAVLGATTYMYSKSLTGYEDAYKQSQTRARVPGYNPYILNQFQTLRDTIYSASLAENRIENKPSHVTDGVYGISEHHIKLSPGDPYTVVTQKINLNR